MIKERIKGCITGLRGYIAEQRRRRHMHSICEEAVKKGEAKRIGKAGYVFTTEIDPEALAKIGSSMAEQFEQHWRERKAAELKAQIEYDGFIINS